MSVHTIELNSPRRRKTETGAILAYAGAAAFAIAADIVLLGGHRAIGLMATHANPVQAVNSIAFTIDTVVSALSLAAFALIGAGMLGFAYTAWPFDRSRAWAGFGAATGVLMLVLAWSYAAGPGDLTDWLLLVSGVAAIPAWLISIRRVRNVQPIS